MDGDWVDVLLGICGIGSRRGLNWRRRKSSSGGRCSRSGLRRRGYIRVLIVSVALSSRLSGVCRRRSERNLSCGSETFYDVACKDMEFKRCVCDVREALLTRISQKGAIYQVLVSIQISEREMDDRCSPSFGVVKRVDGPLDIRDQAPNIDVHLILLDPPYADQKNGPRGEPNHQRVVGYFFRTVYTRFQEGACCPGCAGACG